jgi:hypothetical protein
VCFNITHFKNILVTFSCFLNAIGKICRQNQINLFFISIDFLYLNYFKAF